MIGFLVWKSFQNNNNSEASRKVPNVIYEKIILKLG